MNQDDKGTILIVDDSRPSRKICEINLGRRLGYRVIQAVNGKEGLEYAKKYNPDVILLDIMMPIMDGIEMLKILKNDNKLYLIPVLMLSAKAATEDVVSTLEMGANDYLTKPFHVKELIVRVENLIRLKKVEDELRASVTRVEHEAELGVLASGIAHDFNNVLASLDYYECLKEETEEVAHLIPEKFLKNLKFLWKIMGHNIALTKRMCEGIRQFYCSDVLQVQQVQQLRPHIIFPLQILERKLKGIIIKKEIVDVPSIRCNGGEMQQIVLNLLVNAHQAVNQVQNRTGEISIKLWGKDNLVHFSISDNGIGIAPEHINRIYEPHFTTKETGSGRGLATVKKIIKNHHGDISLVSKLGEGTKFVLTFPAIEGEEG